MYSHLVLPASSTAMTKYFIYVSSRVCIAPTITLGADAHESMTRSSRVPHSQPNAVAEKTTVASFPKEGVKDQEKDKGHELAKAWCHL